MGCFFAAAMAAPVFAAEWEVTIQPDEVVREVDLSNLLGGNVGFWYSRDQVQRVVNHDYLRRWSPGLLRIPGGSWGDEIYWNGNGVRNHNSFDHSKLIDGHWQIDYSSYQPGFRVIADGSLSSFHGSLDALTAHEFVRDCGSSALVTVNAGTGTAEMAAEWVRWANQIHDFEVRYWEVGNELEGKWEQGHFLPDGNEMNAEIYAERFEAFARAMKAVDPTIKVGGPSASNDSVVFGGSMLDRAGEFVDFISYHTYPVGGRTGDTAAMFARTDQVVDGVRRLRDQLREKVPLRADEIEIGITEWHVGVHEGPYTVNQLSGPWCAKWIGRMMEAGVDFANIWDLFSASQDGGHGVFGRDDEMTPRGALWALTLWNEEMSGTLLSSQVSGGPGIAAFATRTERGVSLLLVNENEFEPAQVRVKLGAKTAQGTLAARELSAANYLWNEHAHRPVWSLPPVDRRVSVDDAGTISVPPFAAMVVHLGAGTADTRNAPPAKAPKADVIAPENHPADVPFSVWVTLTDTASHQPFVGPAQTIKIETTGPLECKTTAPLTLHRPALRVEMIPTGSGLSEIIVRAAGGESRRKVNLKEVEERSEVVWSFEEDADLKAALSSFEFRRHGSTEKNANSTEIFLDQRKAGELGEKNRLIEFSSLPAGDRSRVGGVVFRARTSPGFAADPHAKLTVVLLSRANHWMPLGDVPLSGINKEWSEHRIRLTDMSLLNTMADLYSMLILVQTSDPLAGSLFLDDLGFLTRH